MFKVGDTIAHPMHGAGVISDIEERRINGVVRSYYVMRMPIGDMLVMIPVANSADIGVRGIISEEQADDLLAKIVSLETNMTQNWNRRYRENMLRIKSGDLVEVARVVKGLMERDIERGLSTGERSMLHSAKQILISELVLAKHSTYEEIEKKINGILLPAKT
ncbi:MAG: CarD family transcriptional regulator [Oscillospiraceae bacterium]|nr:CarD family transcriptional regulator [Oscillospiraceae bacterium]